MLRLASSQGYVELEATRLSSEWGRDGNQHTNGEDVDELRPQKDMLCYHR